LSHDDVTLFSQVAKARMALLPQEELINQLQSLRLDFERTAEELEAAERELDMLREAGDTSRDHSANVGELEQRARLAQTEADSLKIRVAELDAELKSLLESSNTRLADLERALQEARSAGAKASAVSESELQEQLRVQRETLILELQRQYNKDMEAKLLEFKQEKLLLEVQLREHQEGADAQAGTYKGALDSLRAQLEAKTRDAGELQLQLDEYSKPGRCQLCLVMFCHVLSCLTMSCHDVSSPSLPTVQTHVCNRASVNTSPALAT
jgi:chromosome segregation ATPase